MNKPESDSAEGLAVGLAYLLKAGFVFVRLDQVDLKVIPEIVNKKSQQQERASNPSPAKALPQSR
jgi:hypothetical protein